MQAYLVSRRAVEEALSGPARVTVGDGEAAPARSGCRVGPGPASDPGGPGVSPALRICRPDPTVLRKPCPGAGQGVAEHPGDVL